LNDTLTKTGIIAIVDDDEALREALKSVMQASGFLTNTFASAEEFLDSSQRRNTTCLLLDVRLPGMIFVTAHGDAAIRDLVMKAGAAGFLNKPVRSDALLKEINAALVKAKTDIHS
jgi:FixJ family two-component response regulator